MTCVVCGQILDPTLVVSGITTHPTCLFAELDDQVDPAAQELKSNIIDIVKWADRRNPRASQVAPGPSEIGTPCDRRLGYRLAEIAPINTDTDPWAAIIGTAMHTWLEVAFSLYCEEKEGECDWVTESSVSLLGGVIKGRSDLYSRSRKMVIDHKGAGNDVMRKVRKNGPPVSYVTQLQLYGLGYEDLGYEVNSVALVFYPRAGWLKDLYVWVAPYSRDWATRSLDRVFEISKNLVDLDVINQPHRWEQVAAWPGDECGFCPLYDPGRDPEKGASDTGCPAR